MAAVLANASLDGAAVVINQLTAASHRDGAAPIIERAGGNIDPALIGISQFEPVTSLTTSDILTALGISSFLTAGYYCEDESILPLNSRANGAVFDAGSNHHAIAGALGLLVPMTIEAPANNGSATMQMEMHWVSEDGFTPCPEPTTGNALTTGSFVASFVCGKAFINGTKVETLQSFTVNTGITVEIQRDSGSPYPYKIFITKREPTIDLVFENEAQGLAVLNSAGIVSGSGGAGVYLRKRADRSTFVADATTEHIKLGFTSGLTRLESFSGVAVDGNSTFTIRLHGKALTAATGVAIP
jgi:hypothetical protein